MPSHVVLLRGVNNLGGKKVAMADLREVMASLGHTDVMTYIQSGNVLFTPRPAAGSVDTYEPLVAADYAVIETIKRAEDGNGLIVRLYETRRWRGKVTLLSGVPLASASICNLLEEDERAVDVVNDSLTLDITPYQIITLRLVPA